MKISFWSPFKGESCVTSNLACISTMFSMMYHYKSIIIENHLQQNRISHFLQARINKNIIFEDSHYHYRYTGMDSILYQLSMYEGNSNETNSRKVKEIIELVSNKIFEDQLFYLSNDNRIKRGTFESTIKQHILTILKASEMFADVTFIDTQSSNNLSTPLILQEADLIVVNLSQDPKMLQYFFENYSSILSKSIILIRDYEENSYYNLDKISRTYKLDKLFIATISHNKDYNEALNSGSLISFLIRNYQLKIEDSNACFVNDIKNATKKIHDSLSFNINRK